MKQKPNPKIQNVAPIAEAVSKLFYPHVEIVIHSLTTQKIVGIYNPFSKRKIGDESLLEQDHDFNAGADVLGPYPKMNWNGKALKSVTAVLRDDHGRAEFLMCMNFDVTIFDQLKNVLSAFTETKLESQPQALFKDDWREKINLYIDQHLRERNTCLQALSKKEQQELVQHLHSKGAFQGKNAAEYLGQILGLSRATIYNYLRT
jgi:predicted transcriptional regulator YheO